MATWNLSPQYKKSAVERQYWYKDGKTIVREEGFRWATFTVQSDDRPLTDDELKNEDGYELGCIDNDESWEMVDMIDGCWADFEKGRNCTDEDLEEFETAWEEDTYESVEALGWVNDETEYWYYGPLELTNEDTGQVFQGEPDEVPTASPDVMKQAVTELVENYANFVEDMTDEEWDDFGREEKPIYTDWYPVSTNPVRNGTYQVLHEEMQVSWPFESNVKSAEWDGKKWNDKKIVKWRGLTEDPNEA